VFFQVLLNGLFVGSVYCLISLGLTLILGVMDIADFAQGAMIMLGAFLAFFGLKVWGFNYVFVFICASLAVTVVGIINNIIVYRPAMRRGANTLIVALGILLIIQNLALLIFGPDYHAINLPFGSQSIYIAGATISIYKGTIILIALTLVIFVALFLQRTKIGKAIRAISQDKEGAAIVGIDGSKVSVVTFGIGTFLIGLTGTLLSPVYAFDVHFGLDLITKAFIIVIFGGLGSIRGAILGALIIGIGENMIAGYISTEYSSLLTFLLLIAILFSRPQGVFGEKSI